MSKDKPKGNSFKLSLKKEFPDHAPDTKKHWDSNEIVEKETNINQANDTDAQMRPVEWNMTKNVNLYKWQQECMERWFLEKKGTIKVVTGAGKTILALAIIESLKKQITELVVAIVVPTIVLQNQWYNEILKNSNLSDNMIGRLGGGYDDNISDEKRIVIAVLKSASEKLYKKIPEKATENLLLIVDECHRAGAKEMSKIFNTKRKFNLGLSATPERGESSSKHNEQYNNNYSNSLLGRELGPIIFELNVKQALAMGILPEFEIIHIGISLNNNERYRYRQLSRAIRKLDKDIRNESDRRITGENMMAMLRSYAKENDSIGMLARQYIHKTNERKQLLYKAESREKVILKILEKHIKHNPTSRGIIFHESIEAVMNLHKKLLTENYPAVVENSKLPKTVRRNNIESFRNGTARVIVSARSLIEGFNVPETDIGIIAASSTSVRQRIQTLGRVLRKTKKDADNLSKIYVLYARETVDENIYMRANWEQILGAKRNQYYIIDQNNQMIEQSEPPKIPIPSENEININELVPGDVYPGEYKGNEYSCDSNGNVFDENKNVIVNPQGITELVKKVKGSYGRFKVSFQKKYVIVLTREQNNWITRYVTQLQENFKISQIKDKDSNFSWDEVFPLEIVPNDIVNDLKLETLFFKQKHGRAVIARKNKKGEQYAREQNALNKDLGENATKLINNLKQLHEQNKRITKFFLADNRYIIYLEDGKYRHICKINNGLEFP
ncbi:MAG: DEAD/DEAH box helicase [Clostridiales bacterium]|nr:DEAD/DEAH box helicase [Clostridiales bacterium]